MSNNPVPFNFNNHSLRIFPSDDGLSFWAVAKDVADILGHRDAFNATLPVPDAHKGTRKVSTPGGEQEMLCIDEAGLYRMILRSNKPEAEPFMEWITAEVLPAIRRTGSYQGKDADTYKIEAAHLREQIEALRTYLRRSHKLLLASNEQLEKLVHYWNLGLNATECGKLLDINVRTAQKRIAFLKSAGVINEIQGGMSTFFSEERLAALATESIKH